MYLFVLWKKRQGHLGDYYYCDMVAVTYVRMKPGKLASEWLGQVQRKPLAFGMLPGAAPFRFSGGWAEKIPTLGCSRRVEHEVQLQLRHSAVGLFSS
jgi:hypothetical protein